LYDPDDLLYARNVVVWVKQNIQYEHDKEVYNKEERWSSGEMTVSIGKGDCDDMGIVVNDLLEEAHHPPILCYGKYRASETLHVWTKMWIKGKWWILDPVQETEHIMISDTHDLYKYYDESKHIYPWLTVYYQFGIPLPIPRFRRYRIASILDYPTDFP